MRRQARTFQTFSLLIGALALVLSSAGLVGASPAEGEDARDNRASAVPDHAAEKQGGPDDVDDGLGENTETETETDTDTDNTTDDVADDGDNAHPSGNDRSVEPGSSGDQGKAESDPDDDGNGPDRTNGGADKPGGEGGVDEADRDGNNGCGNDDDFEDDNEGLCLGPDGAPGQQDDDASNGDEDNTADDDDNGGEQPQVDDGDEGSDEVGADMVTICHATGSETNPYVVITVSENAILNPAGHGDHEDDIIPAFDGFEGQGDVALIADGCEVDDVDNGGEEPEVGDGDEGSDEVGADMVTICHATGSETNPYVVITVSENAILNPAGHGDHEDDIIPAFDGFEGQGDVALIADGCEVDDVDNGGEESEVPVENPEIPAEIPEVPAETPEVEGVDEERDEDVGGEVVVNIPATPALTPATPATPALRTVADRNPTQVLGSQVTRSSQLPRTGDETTNLVPFGLGLVLLGFGLQRTSKRFSAARAG